jgi:uncharacterized protein (TIGR03663 family)
MRPVPRWPLAERGRLCLNPAPRAWWLSALGVLAVATVLRLAELDLKPFHHDEGVNGHFLLGLYRNGVYHYDPANFHGPTLVYLAWLSAHVFGLTDFALRLVPAASGVAIVALILGLRGHLGPVGATSAAALLAVSPGATYFSRYFIHESLFAFLTLALVGIAIRYRESPRPLFAAAGGTVVALMCATKETAVLALSVLALAGFLAHQYSHLRGIPTASLLPRPRKMVVSAAVAVSAFVVLAASLFSVFFADTAGIGKALGSLKFWSNTATSSYRAPTSSYLEWLTQGDPAVLWLGLAGCLYILVRPTRPFHIFCALWALGAIVEYSLIPYKTPWLTLNMIVPLAAAAGCGFEALARSGNRRGPVVAAVLASAGVAVSAAQAARLNFDRYDDETGPYAYVTTQRGTFGLLREIARLAAADGTGTDIPITIDSRDYWPLPWYLRDYSRATYGARFEVPAAGTLVVVNPRESPGASRKLRGYLNVGAYVLRQGVTLDLYAPARLLRRSPRH